MAASLSSAEWVAQHQLGKHIQHAIAKLVMLDPRPDDPVAVLGQLLIDSAAGGGCFEPKVEAHEKKDVDENVATLRACAPDVLASMGGVKIRCVKLASPPADVPSGSKLVHFIRHGEGFHNVAQREWRADPLWDGKSEPYTIDTDPDGRYVDAELNGKGKGQATDLQQLTAGLKPELLVVSPMRRATLTGLLAFEAHIACGELPVLANELCHERAGRHTCDRRLPLAELTAAFPAVDYAAIQSEEDPYWGDGTTREPWKDLGVRAGAFATWLFERPESHVAVAAHSAFLLATFNAVLDCDGDETSQWFGTRAH